MKAFIDTPVTRNAFVADIERHYELDQYIQGTYWQEDDNRGCAVGCVLHTFAPERQGEPAAFEDLFGIPVQVAQLQDVIFEGLPNDEAKEWPRQFASAIQEGADLSLVWNRFAVWMLIDSEYGVTGFAADNERPAIERVAALHQRVISGNMPTDDEWDAAWAAARAAARAAAWNAAWNAAWAAAWNAAWDAAWAAAWAAAWDAVWDAVWDAAWDAAWNAARAAHYRAMRDKLLDLLREAQA